MAERRGWAFVDKNLAEGGLTEEATANRSTPEGSHFLGGPGRERDEILEEEIIKGERMKIRGIRGRVVHRRGNNDMA